MWRRRALMLAHNILVARQSADGFVASGAQVGVKAAERVVARHDGGGGGPRGGRGSRERCGRRRGGLFGGRGHQRHRHRRRPGAHGGVPGAGVRVAGLHQLRRVRRGGAGARQHHGGPAPPAALSRLIQGQAEEVPSALQERGCRRKSYQL